MTENTTPVVPQNVPFNLIVAQTRTQVRNIASHFDLSDVRFVDDLKLPEGGPKRGDALNELLSAQEHTVTLAVLVDSPWVDTLVDNNAMAAGVWRSVETKLLGHRTSQQRNLIVVAKLFVGSVRKAEDERRLITVASGQPLPNHWKPAKAATEGQVKKILGEQIKTEAKKLQFKKPENMQKDQTRRQKSRFVIEGEVALNTKGVKNFGKKGKGGNFIESKKPGQEGIQLSEPGNPQDTTNFLVQEHAKLRSATAGTQVKGRVDRSKKTGKRPIGNHAGLYDDLYLLCKGHYGTAAGELLIAKARAVIAHHTGVAGPSVEVGTIVSNLFQALIGKSGRGYWGGFNLLQQLAVAAGKGPYSAVEVLCNWINKIPVRDAQGSEVPQPKVNKTLQGVFGVVDHSEQMVQVKNAVQDAVTTA